MLLIDEIDKTDQEFEAMLLEVLSDFQISIPELGVVEAQSRPLGPAHLEQLARAHRGAEAPLPVPLAGLPGRRTELEIVRLHAPELDQRVARRLVEVVHMVRSLDLKKPPSIAESIDWARALVCSAPTRSTSRASSAR